jgi:ectoine hydroxylase-related dioxygenase (phytanoyl-CoA dioxygenase family)
MSSLLTSHIAWIEAVERLGFVIVDSVFAPWEMQQLLAELSTSTLPRSRAGIRHAMRNPAVTSFANDSRLIEIASAILGSTAFPYRVTLFDKSPEANWLITWHQDTALPLKNKVKNAAWGPWSVKDRVLYAHAPASALEQVLTLRIHLDHANAMSGALRVLPGTHKLGVLDDEGVLQLAQQASPVDCDCPRGAVLVMRPLLVHASSKSEVSAPRRVLHVEYAAAPIIEGLELAVA